MDITFDQYIKNPSNIRSMTNDLRLFYEVKYRAKWDNLMVRENNKVTYHLYTDGTNYFVYIKMPSETVEEFYYDTVIKFSPNEKAASQRASLKTYYVKFFSNDPSFLYNAEYAFNKNKLLIEELTPRMSKMALHTPARETNPNSQVIYIKSLYFAYIFINRKGLWTKSLYTNDTNFKANLLAAIKDTEIKVAERIEAGKDPEAATKRIRQEKRLTQTNVQADRAEAQDNKTVKLVGKTKKTTVLDGVKHSKTSKFVKRH